MIDKNFTKRIMKFGIWNLLISWDTLGFIVTFILLVVYTNGNIDFTVTGKDILDVFITVSSTFFAIVLTGLAIISSFADREFIKAWVKIGEYGNIITLFQYNLYVPLVLLIVSFILRFIHYNPVLMMISISLFVYMILALVDLVKFISKYALQRGCLIEAVDNQNRSR
jgi:hypothetical protein